MPAVNGSMVLVPEGPHGDVALMGFPSASGLARENLTVQCASGSFWRSLGFVLYECSRDILVRARGGQCQGEFDREAM
jgi:hypothetical protein